MLWIFALIVFLPAPIPAADVKHCLNSTKSKFNLSCSDDGKIFDVNISAAFGDCEQSSCNGNTPQLIMQKLSCYWKNNCIIDLPKDIIVQSTDDSDKCTGTKPDILVLYSWKCTKKGVQIYDFTEKIDFNMSLEKGILRSHSRFPWDYFFSDFCTNCENSAYNKTVTFWLKPMHKFVITVHQVNVTEPDSLTWYTKQNTRPIPVSVGTMVFNDSAEAISLQLNLNEDTNGDSGFLICYESIAIKALSSGNTGKDACSDLTTSDKKHKSLISTGDKDTRKRKGDKKKGKNKTENNGKQKSGSKPSGKKRHVS